MERAGVLIKRLLEQYENNASTGSMLVTAQMLLKELQNSNQGEVNSGKKVSVIIPSLPAIDKIVFEENSGSFQNEIIPGAQNPLKDETSAPVISSPKSIAQPVKKPDPHNIYSLIEEMPTFTYQQKSSSELNDTMTAREESHTCQRFAQSDRH